MKNLNLICASVIISFLAGCAQFAWHHPSKNQNDFNRDKYNCERQAANMYPIHMVQEQSAPPVRAPQSSTTNCDSLGYSIRCTTTPDSTYSPKGNYIPPPYDANNNNRRNAISSCMQADGWELRQVNNSPPQQQQYSQSSPARNFPALSRRAGESCSNKFECSGLLECESNKCVSR